MERVDLKIEPSFDESTTLVSLSTTEVHEERRKQRSQNEGGSKQRSPRSPGGKKERRLSVDSTMQLLCELTAIASIVGLDSLSELSTVTRPKRTIPTSKKPKTRSPRGPKPNSPRGLALGLPGTNCSNAKLTVFRQDRQTFL